MELKKIVESYKDEMIANLRSLISYESVLNPTKEYPFGKEVALCLDEALKMCQGYGFKVHNLDYYAGYAEIGSGEKLIGILGHLDIVPLGEGWTHPPLQGDIVDGYMYGRGTSDDKGPVVAAMVAMKIVNDMHQGNLKKRIRLIMGCNEESGSLCLKHYVEKEGHIDYGFTPDGSFPGCFGEKGGMHLRISGESNIISIRSGLASNIVPNLCLIEVSKDSFNPKKLEAYFKNNDLKYEIEELESHLILKVYGVAAHASLPHLGKNAISYAFMGLHAADYQDSFVDYYVKHIATTTDGSLMNVAMKDAYGELTFSVGMADKEEHKIVLTVDIRYPVSFNSVQAKKIVEENTKHPHVNVEIAFCGEPLFFEPTSPLVSMLKSAYQEVSKKDDEVITMGGGTYAKGIKNCIAFGGEFPGIDVHMHDADEFIRLQDLLQQTEIYVVALLKLLDYEG